MFLALVYAGCATDGETVESDPPEMEDPTTPTTPTEPTPGGEESLSEASTRVLDQFTQCMRLEDFRAANMAAAWSRMTTSGVSYTCTACHASGTGGFIATEPDQTMFDLIKANRYYVLQFVTVDLAQGAAAAKVVINRASFRGVGLGQVPHAEHPRFNPDTNAGMTALQRFYDLTMARIATECAPAPQ